MGQKSGCKKKKVTNKTTREIEGSTDTYHTTENVQEELSNHTATIKKSKWLRKELQKEFKVAEKERMDKTSVFRQTGKDSWDTHLYAELKSQRDLCNRLYGKIDQISSSIKND